MKKYGVIQNYETRRAAQYEDLYETREEALEAAENDWDRMSTYDRKTCDEFYVADCEVDEDGCIDVVEAIKYYKEIRR